MTTAPPQVYPGVDWITLTTGVSPDADVAYQRARALAVEQVAAGDRLRPWGANGYRGFGTPHLRCGQRAGDVLVELSGELAELYWRDFWPLAHNVSRLDTAVTVTFPEPVGDLAWDAYKAPRVARRPGLPAIGKTLMVELGRGQTCYLGSKKSAKLGRLYDKSAEAHGGWPPNSWRWEVQERRHMGSTTASALYDSNDVHSAIRAHVRGFFAYHGVNPWFLADGPSLHSPARRSRPDVRRYESYLARSIAPGVRRWIDAGYGDAIFAALGVSLGDFFS
jgi:hypothetical protein